MVHVKVCGVTNLDDALASLDAGAGYLGFNFYRKSPRYISPADARLIVEALPAGVTCVGVFVNEAEPCNVQRIAGEAGISAVQLHGDETPEFCSALAGLWTMKALRVGPGFRPELAPRYETDAVLLDTHAAGSFGGTGRTFDWSLARSVSSLVSKLFLAGGLSPENVAAAVGAVRPFAVDVCSGVETSPGRKSAPLVRRFVEAVRGWEQEA